MDHIERSNRAEPLWVGRQPREIRVHSGDDGSVVYFVPEGEVESLRQQLEGAVEVLATVADKLERETRSSGEVSARFVWERIDELRAATTGVT